MTRTTDGAGRPYGGESAAERRERRRAQLLAAGLELFGTLGYRHTTVRGLCKQAGVTDRYFYEQFANMEELLIGVHAAGLDRTEAAILAAVAEYADEQDPEPVIRAGLDAFFRELEDRRLARVLWQEVIGVSPAVDEVYQGGVRRFASFVRLLTEQRFPQLRSPDAIVDVVAIALVGAVNETALQWRLRDYDTPRETITDALTTIFLGTGLVGGPGAA